MQILGEPSCRHCINPLHVAGRSTIVQPILRALHGMYVKKDRYVVLLAQPKHSIELF